MRRSLVLALALVIPHFSLRTPHSPAADKPVPTADAAAKMTVPEGFRVTLFAGEPDVVQPIAFTFDDRGRMWVVECLSYPKWRPDGKGGDRVTILEDTDGDGRHDKRTVFLDNGCNLSGIEVGFGGVWLCSVPNLVFVPDRNGDDKPDGPPEVKLDGWNIKDTKHNVFNSLNWGPDGWLYGCNGIQSKSAVGKPGTPDKDRVKFDCGVWRYHPTRATFEVVAWGTTNPWGVDWDDHGELFITNCVIDHLFHFVPGGHYTRMYGEDPNPFAYSLMGHASDHKHWGGGAWTSSRADQKTGALKKEHDDAGGGHAHSGCAVYLGDNFPPDYRNSVFTANIHGNRLNRDSLHRTETGYVGKHEKDFLFANDPWFRGVCVKQGPDGGLYAADWTDTGECHNYDVADTSNGRIYRVVFGNRKGWTGDVSKMTDEELIDLHESKNEWLVRRARLELLERLAVSGKPNPVVVGKSMSIAISGEDAPTHLRGLWTHIAYRTEPYAGFPAFTMFTRPHIRAACIRLGLSDGKPSKEFVQAVIKHAADAQKCTAAERREILSGLRYMPDDAKLRALDALSKNPTAPNRDLDLLAWYGVQPAVLTHPDEALRLAGRTTIGLVRENIVRCYLTRPGVDLAAALEAVAKLLADVTDDTARKQIIGGVRLATVGRRDVAPPKGWAATYAKLQDSPDPGVRNDAETLAVQFGDEAAIAAVKARLLDASQPPAARRSALERLSERKLPDFAPTLRGLLADPAVRGTAIKVLAAYPDAESPAAILRVYPTLTAAEKADAVQTLASRPAFALALLDAIEKGAVPKSDVTVFTARQIQSLKDAKVADRLAKVWGTIRPASQTRVEQAKRIKELLSGETPKAADVVAGRGLYAKHCAACHKMFGEGGDVGPELTGAQRTNLDYVLENVLDPSAVVPGEFRMTAFTLLDGRLVSGIVKKETPQAVTVRTLNEELTVPLADVESRKPTQLSIMPDGLFDMLKPEELRDLIAYLASPSQVGPPPK